MAATQIVLACFLVVLFHNAVSEQPDHIALPEPSADQCDAFMNMAIGHLESLSLQIEQARDLDAKTQATLDACQTTNATPEEVATCKEDAQATADQEAINELNTQLMVADIGREFISRVAKCKSAANNW